MHEFFEVVQVIFKSIFRTRNVTRMLLHDFHHLLEVLFPNLIGNREAVCRAPNCDFIDLLKFRFVARV
jgi:hypothetical protein